MTRRSVITFAALFSSTALCATAMNSGDQGSRFTSAAAAVRVDVLVTDRGQMVSGLTTGNFELRDNGVVQQIADLSRESLPLNVIGVLDVSGSVAGEPLRRLREGMTSLIDALIDKDRAALVTFSERLRIHTNLTDDRAKVRAMVEQVKAGGATAFFDATFAGLALREADQGRTLLLLFSDGIDTASWLTAQRVLEAARRTDVVIYPVTIKPNAPLIGDSRMAPSARQYAGSSMVMLSTQSNSPRADQAQKVLEALAGTTGGRVVYADARRPLGETFVAVLSEFRQRYVLSYSPSDATPGWHAIDVRLRDRSGQVTARRGYFSSPPNRQGPSGAAK